MEKMEWLSQSADETVSIAKEIAKKIKPGTVIALSGNLGSGKTTFIKGLAEGFGLKDHNQVTSPTFALMHIYPSKPQINHFDLYRLESVKEVQDIGFEEFISDSNVVTCVEWAEKAASLMPKDVLKINFEVLGESLRKISMDPR